MSKKQHQLQSPKTIHADVSVIETINIYMCMSMCVHACMLCVRACVYTYVCARIMFSLLTSVCPTNLNTFKLSRETEKKCKSYHGGSCNLMHMTIKTLGSFSRVKAFPGLWRPRDTLLNFYLRQPSIFSALQITYLQGPVPDMPWSRGLSRPTRTGAGLFSVPFPAPTNT